MVIVLFQRTITSRGRSPHTAQGPFEHTQPEATLPFMNTILVGFQSPRSSYHFGDSAEAAVIHCWNPTIRSTVRLDGNVSV